MVTFPSLGMTFSLFEGPVADADVDEEGSCEACGAAAAVRFAGACYACFRGGRPGRRVTTEHGLVDEAAAEAGRVIEVDPDGPDHPPRPAPGQGLEVEPALLRELLRTPATLATQGDGWLFCCGRPMVFTGALEVGGRGSAEVAALLEAHESIDPEVFLEQILDGSVRTWAFRCSACGRVRAQWDCL